MIKKLIKKIIHDFKKKRCEREQAFVNEVKEAIKMFVDRKVDERLKEEVLAQLVRELIKEEKKINQEELVLEVFRKILQGSQDCTFEKTQERTS